MPIRVQVIGHGLVEFPDGTSQEVMQAALSKLSTPQEPPKPTPDQGGGLTYTIGEVVKDLGKGALAGAASTVYQGGDLIRRGVGMNRIINTPQVQGRITPPNTTAGKVGYAGEQIGEFFTPTGAPKKIAKVAEIAKAGLLSLTQSGGDPLSAGLSAGVTAVLPGAGAARRAAGALETSANKSMAQALGATKEWAKSDAAKVAPGMLARGIHGSRAAMLEQASGQVKSVGAKIAAEIQAAAAQGKTIDGLVARGNLQLTRDALMVKNAAGVLVPIEGAAASVKKLDRLEAFVAQLGDQIPFDKAEKIKIAWDRIVSKAGLYGPKATSSATDNANAWAIREAASGFRQMLAQGSPTLADLNKEYAFWKGLKGVLVETEKRTQAQGGGLVSGIGGVTGAASGFASGDSLGDSFQKALLGGFMGRQVVKLLQSPAWRTTVSGPLKQAMADALASGSQGQVFNAVRKITASLPPQLRPAYAP